jgi:ABC-type multidrug transport system ATPase subunit
MRKSATIPALSIPRRWWSPGEAARVSAGPDLHFERVSRSFGTRVAVREVSLRCPGAAATCVIGPNGAGKSTLLAVAAGLLAPSTGRVRLGERELRSVDGLSYLPQSSAFPGQLTAREVLDFAAAARGSAPRDREAVYATSGVEAILDRTVRELSGGWVRRLGLAVSLLSPSRVLLLDEPFVGLDPDTLERLTAHLAERASQGAPVVLASHEFELADRLAPHVAVLDEGRLVAVVPPRGERCRDVYRGTLGRAAVTQTRAPRMRAGEG